MPDARDGRAEFSYENSGTVALATGKEKSSYEDFSACAGDANG